VTRCTKLAIVITLVCAGLLCGCVFPSPGFHAAGSRQNVNAKATSELQPGTTTMEEVLFLLGEPDSASPDGRQFEYVRRKVFAWVEGGSGFWREYRLLIVFDPTNRVSHVGLLKEWKERVAAAGGGR